MTDFTELAEELYANARAKGFYDHEDWLRAQAGKTATAVEMSQGADPSATFSSLAKNMQNALTEHFGNRLMLIAGEAVEAHEELRSGHGVAELYFTEREDGHTAPHEWPVYDDDQQKLRKPEGVLAELADIAIRTMETMTSILKLASDEEKAQLREQIPQNEATELVFDGEADEPGDRVKMGEVVAAEVIILKHDYNQQRMAMNGGRKF